MKNRIILITCIITLLFVMIGCKNNKNVTITLNPLNGEESEIITVRANEEINSLKIFTNPGYTFSGWFYDNELKRPINYPFKTEKNVVLYGGWFQNLNFQFDIESKTFGVLSVNYSSKVIEIPKMYGSFPVTRICESAFFSNEIIEKVIIPDTIKEIGDRAFAYCENLKEVNIPDTVEKVGNKVFSDCPKIKYNDNNGLKYIDNWLVDATIAVMEKAEFSEDTVGIFPNAFYQNKNISEIVLPKKIKKLYEGTFEGSSLSKLIINESLEEIDILAFRDTLNLKEIEVNSNNNYFSSVDGVLYNKDQTKLILYPSFKEAREYNIISTTVIIGERSFMNNEELTKINMSDNVKTIEKQAFYKCSALENVIFSKNLTKIEIEAFMLCSNLTTINLPLSLEEIEKDVFNRCYKVENLTVPFIKKGNKEITIAYLFGDDVKSLSSIKKLEILGGNCLTKTGIKGLTNLEKLKIGSYIEEIESGAFSDCLKITNFEMDNNPYFKLSDYLLYTNDGQTLIWCLPYIDYQVIKPLSTTKKILTNAFNGVSKINEIILNDGLVEIESNAFNSLLNLNKLIINGKVDILGQDICIGTPKVTIYVTDKSSGENWCEGWNTFNYPVKFNAIFPKIIVDEYERHIEIGESTNYSYIVIDGPDEYNIILTVINEGVGIIEDKKITGLKDGIIIITLEIEGYPESKSSLYIYVGNV